MRKKEEKMQIMSIFNRYKVIFKNFFNNSDQKTLYTLSQMSQKFYNLILDFKNILIS